MKILSATCALALAAFSVSAGAEDTPGYANWGQCISVWVDLNVANWKATKGGGSGQKAAGTTLMNTMVPQYQCLEIDDSWYLVPYTGG
jgi:hypothetical protein